MKPLSLFTVEAIVKVFFCGVRKIYGLRISSLIRVAQNLWKIISYLEEAVQILTADSINIYFLMLDAGGSFDDLEWNMQIELGHRDHHPGLGLCTRPISR